MEIIYPNTKYSNSITQSDGAAFLDKPCVVLYSNVTKKWYKADSITPNESNATRYTFTFSEDITKKMIQGVYSLEVYLNDDMNDLLKRIDEFAKVVNAAASPGSIHVTTNE